jgi:O-acetylserine/cysteine efflux transporter
VSCILGAVFLKDYLGVWRTLGMGVAFAGILTIAGTPQVLDHELAFVLAVLGATAWAGSNVYMKVVEQNAIMPLLFWTGLYSLPVTLVVSLLIEGHPWELIETAPASAWIGLTYTVFFSTIAGYGLWYWLITRFSITQVTPFALLVPVGGLSSGMIFFDEEMSLRTAIGAALTIFGVAMITLRRPRLARPDTA